MDPVREDFWGIPHELFNPELVVYGIMFAASEILVLRFALEARRWWQTGRGKVAFDQLGARKGVERIFHKGFQQRKLCRGQLNGLSFQR